MGTITFTCVVSSSVLIGTVHVHCFTNGTEACGRRERAPVFRVSLVELANWLVVRLVALLLIEVALSLSFEHGDEDLIED